MRALLLIIFATTGLLALEVGEKAPGLDSVSWIAGTPVIIGKQVTIVEFWATWCAPCRTSIPHLTKLARAEPDKLAVVGLSDEDAETVHPFVARMGDQMRYPVGVVDEKLHAAYMEGQSSIPFAFLVDAEGTVVWKGHPMAIDRPLAQVLAGTFDRTAEQRRAQRSAELQALLQEEPGPDESRLLKRILAKTAEILADDPLNEEAFDLRLGIAEHQRDATLIRATFEAVPLPQLDATRAAMLTMRLVNAQEPAWRMPDLAWIFAQHAVAADADAGDAHAALAAVQQQLGRLDEAIASQMQAAKLDPENQATALAYYREVQRLRNAIAAGKPITAPAADTAPTSAGPASLVP